MDYMVNVNDKVSRYEVILYHSVIKMIEILDSSYVEP